MESTFSFAYGVLGNFPALLVLQMTAPNWWELNAIFSKEISLGD
jgi:hypothetical protein